MKKAKIAKFFKNIFTFKPRRILEVLMLSLSFILMISFSFAWFSGRAFSFNTSNKDALATLATLEDKVDVIGYSLVEEDDEEITLSVTEFKESNEENSANKFINADSFTPGALNGASALEVNNIIAANTNTKYIKVTNRSDMDIVVKTEFAILEDELPNLTSFWYLISDVTDDIVATDISTYQGSLDDEEDEEEIKILTYATFNKSSRTANNYNENNINVKTFDNLSNRVSLGQIDEPDDHDAGTTRYFRMDYGLCESALRSSGSEYFNRSVQMDVYIYYGQVNAPDDESEVVYNSIKEVRTADEFINILQNVNLAYHGDTIKLMDDIVVTPTAPKTSIDLTRPLNIDLNGYNLTIEGDFNINYTSSTNITIDASKIGQLFVKGDLTITAPNSNVTIKGANQRAAGESACDLLLYGKIYNGVGRQDDEKTGGLTLDNTYIVCKELSEVTKLYVDTTESLVMQANSKLTITEGVILDEVYSGEITNIHINNYGEVGWIHLESMVLEPTQTLQIYVYNNGLIRGNTYVGSVLETRTGIVLPISANTANTKIIKGIYSNNFTLGGSDNFKSTNITSESTDTQYVSKIKGESNSYRVYLDTTVAKTKNSIIRNALETYFTYNGEVNADSIKAIEKLVIECTTDTYIDQYDFAYLNSEAFRDLSTLDLSLANAYTSNYKVATQRYNRIPDSAFLEMSSLTSITLPTTLKYIGTKAFYDTGLTSITIPSLVESIGINAFNTVSEVTIEGLYPLNNASFLPAFGEEVYYLVDESVVDTFKSQFTSYGTSGKYKANHVYCYSFLYESRYIRLLDDGTIEIVAFTGDIADGNIVPTTIEYEGNTLVVSSIGRDAYINTKNESGLTLSLLIGEGVKNIGKNAFANLNFLQNVTIIDATTIDSYAFNECSALERVTIGGQTTINSYAFYKCSAIDSLYMEGVISIQDNAFNGCSSISNLVIPNVTYLGESAFAGCTSFKSVVLGRISKISDGTFKNCKLLEEVGLTSTTVEIGASAFEGCVKLSTIYTYEGSNLDGYIYLQYVKTIDSKAFNGCNLIKYVVCDSIETIDSQAFYNCSGLEYLEANTVTTIGDRAFVKCSSLSFIEIESVKTIGASAFEELENIKYAFIPNVETIGSNAFGGCINIDAVALGNFTAGYDAFYDVYPTYVDLSSYSFPSTLSTSTTTIFGGTSLDNFIYGGAKFYFAAGNDDEETNSRMQYLYRILCNTAGSSYTDETILNSISVKKTILGNNIVKSSDYKASATGLGSRTYIGVSRNLGLYNVDVDAKEIVAYHGPALVGYNVLPFNTYSETGISEDDFDDYVDGNGKTTYGKISDGEKDIEIQTIGKYAFYGVEGIMNNDDYCSIVFANSVKTIDASAFQTSTIQFLYCNKVEEIKINAFRGTTELRFVDLGNTKIVGNYAFASLNPSSVTDGSDVDQYFTDNGNLSFTSSKLTKVIFRHVNNLGAASFVKTANSGLLICDFSNNVPNESATDGYGENHNINLPTKFKINWMGFGIAATIDNQNNYSDETFDFYVLAPYEKDKESEIVGSFQAFARSGQIIYNYGYWYNPDYEVNGVKVGMFLLKPPDIGSIDQGLYLYRSFIRNIGHDGELIEGLTTVEGSTKRLSYTIPSKLEASKITVTNGTELTKEWYDLRLSQYSFKQVTVDKNYVCDLYFGDGYTEIPAYCFAHADFANVYTNNIEAIRSHSFNYCSVGTLYCYHVETLEDSWCWYGSCQIIDMRQNVYKDGEENAGETLIADIQGKASPTTSIKAIYVTEDSYDAYVAKTKNVIIETKNHSRTLDTDIELYIYVTVPGIYIGDMNLLNTDKYDLSGLIAPYTSSDNQEIVWYSSDSSIISVDEGIVTVTQTSSLLLTTGSASVYCYRKTTDDENNITKELLCKFIVNVSSEATTINYYNLLVEDYNQYNSLYPEGNYSGFKVVKYSGNIDISTGIFDPSAYLTTYLDSILVSADFTDYSESLNVNKINNKYEIFELGIASYYGASVAVDAYVYLKTDSYLTYIDDYAFYHVAFYEAWLNEVTKVGRKAFLNGSSTNNLVLVYMPNVVTIEYEAFSQNRNLETVIIGERCESYTMVYLNTIGSYAFYAANSLKQFGIVKERLSNLTDTQILNHDYTLTFMSNRKYNYELVGDSYTFSYEYSYYDSDDTFIYLPNYLETLGAYAFYQATNIKEIRLSNYYKFNTIGEYAFALCKNVTLIRTYSNVTNVGQYAFYGLELLPDYEEDDDGNQIAGLSFRYFETIGVAAFRQCYQLREIHFYNIESIGNQAFYYCDKLRFIYFENEWKTESVKFGTNWNTGCHKLLRNYIPEYTESYYSGATNVYFKEALGYTQEDTKKEHEYVVNYIEDAYGYIIGVKIACYNGIIEDVNDDNIFEQIPDYLLVDGVLQPVLAIGKYAYKGFDYQSTVDTIYLPSSVSSVESYAFYDCNFSYYVEKLDDPTSISEVTYGDGVFSYNSYLVSCEFKRMVSGGSSFYNNCANFTTMILVDNYNKYEIYTAPDIEDDFFKGARNDAKCRIKTGTIDLFGAVGYIGRVFENGTEIGDYTVKEISTDSGTKYEILRYNVDEITSNYTVPTTLNGIGVTSIGMSAYTNITVLPGLTLTIPSQINNIDTFAFYGTAFTNVVVEGSDVTFAEEIFAENSSLKTVDLSAVTTLTGTGLFKNDTMLTTVTLNESNTIIPSYYFYGCTNMLSIDIYSTTTIEEYAFANCTSLYEMYSSKTSQGRVDNTVDVGLVTTIGDYAFNGDISISRLDLRSATSIGAYAFENQTGLTSVATILSDATLGEGAFRGCNNLTTFNAAFDTIPDYCFYDCTSLSTVRFTGVTSIGSYAFCNNTSLTSISLPYVLTIGSSAFRNCKKINKVDLGRVNTIYEYAFYNCKALTSIDLKSVQLVYSYAFDNCGLTGELDLKNVTYIGSRAFENNVSLTSVYFRNVESIYAYAFYNDIAIEYLYFDENSLISGSDLVLACPTVVSSAALSGLNSTYLLYVPVNNETLYNKYVSKFYNYKSHIFEHGEMSNTDSNYMIKTKADGTVEIIRFFGETLTTNYTVPQTLDGKTVTSIANYAFTHISSNVNLVTGTLNLGTNITKVGDYAFADLDFSSISLSNVEYIGSYAFANNSKLNYLSLPKAITIGENAFYNNNNLQIVRFYDSIENIGDNAFAGNEELRNVYFSASSASNITNVGEYAFGTLSESSVYLRVPSGSLSSYKAKFDYYSDRVIVGQISDADFSYRIASDGIEIISYEGQDTSVVIPNQIGGLNVVKILDEAFVNSVNLQSVTLPSTLTSISSHAFMSNTTIKYIYVTSGTNNKFVVVDNVLYMKNSSNVISTMVYYPVASNNTSYSFASSASYSLDNVDTIYENAFYGNPYLQTITIPSSIKYIGECAFANMPALTNVTFATPTSGQASVPTLYGTNIFDITVDNLVIYVPSSVLTLYKNDEFFSYYRRFIVAS